MDLLVDAVVGMLFGDRGRPRMDGVVTVVAVGLGLLAGILMYERLFDQGSAGILAWAVIPMAGTVIVATVLGRPHVFRGALVSGAVALAVGLPFAVLHAMFSLWG